MKKNCLLSDSLKNFLFKNYHSYLSECKKNKSKPSWNEFYKKLIQVNSGFSRFTQKQINNKIIDYRKIHGDFLWPILSKISLYKQPTDSELDERYQASETQDDADDTFERIIREMHDRICGNDSIKGITIKFLKEFEDVESSIEVFYSQARKLSNDNEKELQKKIQTLAHEKGEFRIFNKEDFKNFIEISYDLFTELERLRYKTTLNHGKIFLKSSFLVLFSIFDAFVKELLFYIYNKKKELLITINKQISMAEIVDLDNKQQIIEEIILNDLDSLGRESYIKQFESLESRFKVQLKKFDNWKNFVEITQRRNLIQHCDGKITSQYLKLCKENGLEVGSSKNENLNIDLSYVISAIHIFKEVIFYLSQTLWRKQFAEEKIYAVIFPRFCGHRAKRFS